MSTLLQELTPPPPDWRKKVVAESEMNTGLGGLECAMKGGAQAKQQAVGGVIHFLENIYLLTGPMLLGIPAREGDKNRFV